MVQSFLFFMVACPENYALQSKGNPQDHFILIRAYLLNQSIAIGHKLFVCSIHLKRTHPSKKVRFSIPMGGLIRRGPRH